MKKVSVQIRRKGSSTAGRTPRNLPDVHIDENVARVPPCPIEIKDFPRASDYWKLICKTLINRGKLKYNHLPIVSQAVQYMSLAHATTEQLIDLGYVTRNEDGTYRPLLHVLRKSFTETFLKCYQSLTLDPKSEIYDCMLENNGRSIIDMDTYEEF